LCYVAVWDTYGLHGWECGDWNAYRNGDGSNSCDIGYAEDSDYPDKPYYSLTQLRYWLDNNQPSSRQIFNAFPCPPGSSCNYAGSAAFEFNRRDNSYHCISWSWKRVFGILVKGPCDIFYYYGYRCTKPVGYIENQAAKDAAMQALKTGLPNFRFRKDVEPTSCEHQIVGFSRFLEETFSISGTDLLELTSSTGFVDYRNDLVTFESMTAIECCGDCLFPTVTTNDCDFIPLTRAKDVVLSGIEETIPFWGMTLPDLGWIRLTFSKPVYVLEFSGLVPFPLPTTSDKIDLLLAQDPNVTGIGMGHPNSYLSVRVIGNGKVTASVQYNPVKQYPCPSYALTKTYFSWNGLQLETMVPYTFPASSLATSVWSASVLGQGPANLISLDIDSSFGLTLGWADATLGTGGHAPVLSNYFDPTATIVTPEPVKRVRARGLAVSGYTVWLGETLIRKFLHPVDVVWLNSTFYVIAEFKPIIVLHLCQVFQTCVEVFNSAKPIGKCLVVEFVNNLVVFASKSGLYKIDPKSWTLAESVYFADIDMFSGNYIAAYGSLYEYTNGQFDFRGYLPSGRSHFAATSLFLAVADANKVTIYAANPTLTVLWQQTLPNLAMVWYDSALYVAGPYFLTRVRMGQNGEPRTFTGRVQNYTLLLRCDQDPSVSFKLP
jgi:hypothetical protein